MYLLRHRCEYTTVGAFDTPTHRATNPFKAYQTHHKHWFIPADKSFEVPMFWKWFLALHSEGLNDFFEFKATDIPEELRSIQWSKVEDWINKVYN